MQLKNLLEKTVVLSTALFSLQASAQQPFYTFTKTTQTYNEISGGVLVTNTFTQNSYQVNLGIPLKMFDKQTGSSLAVGTNGFIVTTGPSYSFATDPFTTGLKKLDQTSSISAFVESTGNDTVFTIQWKNLHPDSSGPGDYINMQCRLYLRSQTIEFHYGPSSITTNHLADSALDVLAGVFLLSTDFTQSYENQRITGPAANPTIQFDPGTPSPLLGFPANGTVYRFTRKSGVGILENNRPVVSVYPNPANDQVYIQVPSNDIKEVTISTLTGQTLYQGAYDAEKGLDVKSLQPGIYTIAVIQNDGSISTTLLTK